MKIVTRVLQTNDKLKNYVSNMKGILRRIEIDEWVSIGP